MGFLARITWLVALAVGLAATAAAETRVALIIANSKYTNTTQLPNAANDARAVAATLQRVNFKVEPLAENLTQAQMLQVLTAFAAKAREADVALIYYAGHGIEIGGVNYLVPKDASFRTPDDVDFGAVPIDLVMKAVQRAKRLKIVILDSCRDNPFISRWDLRGNTRSIGVRGLAPVEPASETLVAYAAKAGTTAADGPPNGNSPFANALVKFIPQPGVEFRLMFGKVRDEVLSATSGKQEPFIYGSLGGKEFYFVPGKPSVAAGPRTAAEWAHRINEVNEGTPLERLVFLFGPPVYNEANIQVFRAGPWDLTWFGDPQGAAGMAVGIHPPTYFEGPMAKDAQAAGLPMPSLRTRFDDRSPFDFDAAQRYCDQGKPVLVVYRTSWFGVVTPDCFFGRYPNHVFYFPVDYKLWDEATCRTELNQLEDEIGRVATKGVGRLEFAQLRCRAWGKKPYLYFVSWNTSAGPQILLTSSYSFVDQWWDIMKNR